MRRYRQYPNRLRPARQTAARALRRSDFPETNSSRKCRMPNAECRMNNDIQMTMRRIRPERHWLMRASFVILHSSFVISYLPANPPGSRLEFPGENAKVAETRRHTRRSSAYADR